MSRPLRRIYGGANQSKRVKPITMFEGETRIVSCDFKAFSGLKGTTLLSAVWSTDGAITLSGAAVSSGVSSVGFTPDASGLWWVKCLATFANGEKTQITWRVVVIPPDAAGAFGPNAPEVTGPLPITNYTIGEVEFEQAAYEIVGSATYVDVVVVRNSGADGPGAVLYQTTNGTLIAGVDYTAVSGTLVWDALDTSSRTIRITLIDPGAVGDFNVVLSTPTGMVIGDIGTTVVDVPGGGEVAFDESSYLVLDSEPVAVVGIVRVNGSRGDASVDYATSDDTATAPANYTDTSGTANWADGVATSIPVSIPIHPLELVEERAADVLLDWVTGTNEPRDPDGSFQYSYASPSGSPPPTSYGTYAAALTAAESFEGYTLGATLIGWDGGTTVGLSPYDTITDGDNEVLTLHYSKAGYIETVSQFFGRTDYEAGGPGAYTANPNFTNLFALGIAQGSYAWTYNRIGLRSFGGLSVTRYPSTAPDASWSSLNNCDPSPPNNCPYTGGAGLYGLADTQIRVRRVPQAPQIPGIDLPDWPPDPTRYTWDEGTGQIYSKTPYTQTAGSYRWLSLYAVSGGVVVRKPLGPVLPVGDPNDTPEFWQAARDAAVLAGTLPSATNTYNSAGTGGITTFPRNMTYAHLRNYKLPLQFEVGLSNASGAELIEPDTATVYIIPSA